MPIDSKAITTIGPFPAIRSRGVSRAHGNAPELRGRGIDPKEHLKQQKIATDRAKAAADAGLTVNSSRPQFVAEYVRKRHKAPAQTEKLLDAEILGFEIGPKWRYARLVN